MGVRHFHDRDNGATFRRRAATSLEKGSRTRRVLHRGLIVATRRDAGVGKSAEHRRSMAASSTSSHGPASPRNSSSTGSCTTSLKSMRSFADRSRSAGDKAMAISPKRLADQCLLSDRHAEQQRIAACLSSLDALIAAQARKLDAPASPQEGLMQQLFPIAGGGCKPCAPPPPDRSPTCPRSRSTCARSWRQEVRPALRLQRHGQDAAVHRVQEPRQARRRRQRDTLYFNAFTEDLFQWDNDLENDRERVLKINTDSRFFAGSSELEMDNRIRPLLDRYADFDFEIDTTEWEVSFSRESRQNGDDGTYETNGRTTSRSRAARRTSSSGASSSPSSSSC